MLIAADTMWTQRIVDYLSAHQCSVSPVSTAALALSCIWTERCNLVILDQTLPDMDGLRLLRNIRRCRPVPILLLSTPGEEPDRVAGLLSGADDVAPKAISERELLARAGALVRRARRGAGEEPGEISTALVIGALEVNFKLHSISLHGRVLPISPADVALMERLARVKGKVCTREELRQSVRHAEAVTLRAIDTRVARLRRLFERWGKPDLIRTVRSVGYALEEIA
jgi:DNA-binding response OmpR family regulator